jgi:hypothetical protein
MQSSGMLRHVALVRTDILEECITSIIRMTKIGELGTTLAVTSNRSTLRRNSIVFIRTVLWLLVTANVSSSLILITQMMEAIRSSEKSILTRITWHNIQGDGILHSHRHENLKSYIFISVPYFTTSKKESG